VENLKIKDNQRAIGIDKKNMKRDVTEIGLDLCGSKYGQVTGTCNITGILFAFCPDRPYDL
jgi:hypothetical protein